MMKKTIASINEFTWNSKERTLTAPITKWHKLGSLLPKQFEVHGNTRVVTFVFADNIGRAHVFENKELNIRLILTY